MKALISLALFFSLCASATLRGEPVAVENSSCSKQLFQFSLRTFLLGSMIAAPVLGFGTKAARDFWDTGLFPPYAERFKQEVSEKFRQEHAIVAAAYRDAVKLSAIISDIPGGGQNRYYYFDLKAGDVLITDDIMGREEVYTATQDGKIIKHYDYTYLITGTLNGEPLMTPELRRGINSLPYGFNGGTLPTLTRNVVRFGKPKPPPMN